MIDRDSRSGNSEKKDMVMGGSRRHLESMKIPSRRIAEDMALQGWQTIQHLQWGKNSAVRAVKKCWCSYREENRRNTAPINAV